MALKPKSILKEPTIDLYEDVNVISGQKRSEKLFDQLFGHLQQNQQKYDRNCNTKRAPLQTIHANLSPKQRSFDSSDSDNENNVTCVDVNDLDFEPSAKTSKTGFKKNYNRVKFADNIDNRSSKKTKKKNRLKKKDQNYPDCTKESLLKAFQNANLPDYEEIARHELVITKVNGNEALRPDPPTPPLYDILKPFEDLIDWSKVDMKPDENQIKVPSKHPKTIDRKTKSAASDWETTQNSNDSYDDNDDVFDVDFVPNNLSNNKRSNANSDQSAISTSDQIANPSTIDTNDENHYENPINSKLIFKKNERIRTAGLGDSRIASTPVSRRLNVTLKSHNVSPIKSIGSPEAVFDSTQSKVNNRSQQTFVAPLPPTNRKLRKVSIPKDSIPLQVVKPSLSDIEKVTVRRDRVSNIKRSLIDAKTCESCEELLTSDEESHTLIERTQSVKNAISSKSSNATSSDPSVVSKDVSYNLRTKTRSHNKTNELSSIFAPKIKSTPLVGIKQKLNTRNGNELMQSRFDLLVDESRLDTSMSKLFPSKSYSSLNCLPTKTTTIVPVLDASDRRKTVNKNTTAYQIYRKSIASVHSIFNKSCNPCRTVVKARTIISNRNTSSQKVAKGLNTKEDLKQYIDHSFSVAFSTSKVIFNDGKEQLLTAKEKVLLLCDPNHIIDLKYVLEPNILNNCKKIGEGSYGEVYASKDSCGQDIVIKIIPLNTAEASSEEDMFSQILPELVISMNFNHLKSNHLSNKASNFIHMIRATCAKGTFPKKLIDEWHLYAKNKVSENDDPTIYDKKQVYIVLKLANGGTDLESHKFKNAIEAFSLFAQLALSVAAAESEYEFEHRDMHWGNVLINTTDQTHLEYIVNDNTFTLNTNGVFASIIDFSLSRMSKDGFIIFDDLAKYSDLFIGEGDYQFDIYRKMRDLNQNNWQKFCPKTNLFWLHYLLDKLLKAKKYTHRSKQHKIALNMLQDLFAKVLDYESATHFVNSKLFRQYLKEEFK